jgi:D,D-heptose 1,7-bisphosphate phosphatase
VNKAVFLDRDGTITKDDKNLIIRSEDLLLEDGASEAIRILNKLDFKVVVVTNQPQIARGICSEDDVKKINAKMVDDLAALDAKIDAVYFCPHHPEMHSDVPEHAKKYRILCECRKPGPGMLKQAAKDLSIDLTKSFMIGDRTVDIKAGKTANCKTIIVNTGAKGLDKKEDVTPDYTAENLLDAAKIIKNSSIKAVILAGGRGERLRPITDSIPKPMIEIGGKPLIQHQIEVLRRSGIINVVICGSYLVNKIIDYLGDGEKFGVKIYYPNEPERLGSGGAIKNASEFLKGSKRLIIINGDKMIGDGFDFDPMIDFDRENKCFTTLLVRETDHPLDSDILEMTASGKIKGFIGRGQDEYKISNSGIIITGPEIIDYIPDGPSNIEKDVIFNLVKEKEIYGFMLPNGWFTKDIGTPERLEKVRKHFLNQI